MDEMSANVLAVIPARMGSSRFPGKPLARIHGVPMVGHVLERTRLCRRVSDTWVATCDKEIFDYVRSIGGKAVMTADTHERCTDRCAEAMLKIEDETGRRTDIVAMVQGDEPMVLPAMIDQAVDLLLEDDSVGVSCLMSAITTDADFEDPNQVKVVADLKGYALYFSREPVPSRKKASGDIPRFKQVAIIPFRRDYLLRFNELPPTPLEAVESVDLMRVLEHGDRVKLGVTETRAMAVDTPSDLEAVEKAMEGDPLMKSYAEGAAR